MSSSTRLGPYEIVAFLDRIATHIFAFEGESKVTFFDRTARGVGRGVRRGRRFGVRGPRVKDSLTARTPPYPHGSARNFSEYERWRGQQLGDAATRPHRITYRKLTR